MISASQDEAIRLWRLHTGECVAVLQVTGPYAGMNISGVTGISSAQKAALRVLGAVEISLGLKVAPLVPTAKIES